MAKFNLANTIAKSKLALKKNSPHILTSGGVFGMGVALYFAVKNTPWAMELLEARKKELGVSELSFIEKVKTVWRCYAVSGLTFGVSAGSIFAANSIHTQRNSSLAAACSISETALFNLNRQIDEVLGKQKAQEIRAAVAEENLKETPIAKSEVIITSKGDTLCFDAISGRYFESDIERIRSTVNKLNLKLINEMYISLNEFYSELNLSPIAVGNDLGWNVDTGLIEISYSSILTPDDSPRPCLVIDFNVQPRYDYRDLH